jgi:hypothetical protein
MNRREFIAGLGATAWPLVGRAQLRLPMVGWLGTGASPEDAREAITRVKQGLAEIGLGRRPELCVRIPLGRLSFGADAGARRRPGAPRRIGDPGAEHRSSHRRQGRDADNTNCIHRGHRPGGLRLGREPRGRS